MAPVNAIEQFADRAEDNSSSAFERCSSITSPSTSDLLNLQAPDCHTSQPSQRRGKSRQKRMRTTNACARCYQRKIKCDRARPSCSSCVLVDSDCQGFNPSTNTVLPRSITRYLRDCILQKGLESNRSMPMVEVDDQLGSLPNSLQAPTARGPHATTTVDTTTRLDVFDDAPFSHLLVTNESESSLHFPFEAFVLCPSPLPLSTRTAAPNTRVSGNTRTPYLMSMFKTCDTPMQKIPRDIALRLTTNYNEKILPIFPCFNAESIWGHFNRVYEDSSGTRDKYSTYVVSMIIAISIATSIDNNVAKITKLTQQNFAIAAANMNTWLKEPSVRALQAVLLLIQYGFMLPEAVDVRRLVALAMSLVVDLGLHLEPVEGNIRPRPMSIDGDVHPELRRRIFWVAYDMDRSICTTYHESPHLSEDVITVGLPSDEMIKIGSAQLPSSKRSLILTIALTRQIQGEIFKVNWQCQNPTIGLDTNFNTDAEHLRWTQNMEEKVHSWMNAVISSQPELPIPSWIAQVVAYRMVSLHRPCPRRPNPPAESLLKCFEAAKQDAECFLDLLQTSCMRFTFYAVHQGFECAMAMLYALQHGKAHIAAKYSNREVFGSVHQYSSLFLILTRYWPAAARCSDIFEHLKNRVLAQFMDPESGIDGDLEAEIAVTFLSFEDAAAGSSVTSMTGPALIHGENPSNEDDFYPNTMLDPPPINTDKGPTTSLHDYRAVTLDLSNEVLQPPLSTPEQVNDAFWWPQTTEPYSAINWPEVSWMLEGEEIGLATWWAA